ncbi:MAG: hypothetical protein DYG83_12225 [Candidatus Brocadia sp. AMX2]|nr:hypothetical protein [Candidatus Brocadia sp. AMX2]MCQ3919163.1 hypothetical protein [Candidatus Brocadia sp.]RIJ89933.1 MAG: hypothetical protein DB853_13155 [Candidatus Brocadia sp.]
MRSWGLRIQAHLGQIARFRRLEERGCLWCGFAAIDTHRKVMAIVLQVSENAEQINEKREAKS